MKWWKILLGVAVIGVSLVIYKAMTAPAPGVHLADQGQEHESPEQLTSFAYNSNPPTSGPHLVTWVKPGIYNALQSEGELIHSLEHGYVILNYNCNVHLQGTGDKRQETSGLMKKVFAHEGEEDEASPGAVFVDPTIATGSAVNDTQGCKDLVKNLSDLATKNRLWKLIVVPRPQLDTTIALTAWTYIDKFDDFDAVRIEKFINYHRDHGPEQTME